MLQELRPAALVIALMTALTGFGYPLVMTWGAQALFPEQANGSLLIEQGQVVGSLLIGQPFTRPEYFHPRPSYAGAGYDAASSGGSNLGPTNRALVEAVRQRAAAATAGSGAGSVPIELVTASASGLDPDVSPAAALFQVARVAQARGLPEDAVRKLVQAQVDDRWLGLFGEPRVNVLRLNRALDRSS